MTRRSAWIGFAVIAFSLNFGVADEDLFGQRRGRTGARASASRGSIRHSGTQTARRTSPGTSQRAQRNTTPSRSNIGQTSRNTASRPNIDRTGQADRNTVARGNIERSQQTNGNTTTRQTTVQDRAGRAGQSTNQVTRDGDTVEFERDVTRPDGSTRSIEGEAEFDNGRLESIELESEGRNRAGDSFERETEIDFDNGRIDSIERETEIETRFGESIEIEGEIERNNGLLEFEREVDTSWGQGYEVEGVVGRDIYGRPVAVGTIDTNYRGDWAVRSGPYGTAVARLPSSYYPVTYWGRPYYTYGGIYYGSYFWGGSPYYYPAYPPYGVYVNTVPVGAIILTVGLASYYYHDHSYYSETYVGGEVTYEVVAAPVGATITELPDPHATLTLASTTFHYYNHTFYRSVVEDGRSSYVAVGEPMGVQVTDALAADFEPFPVGELTYFSSNGGFYLPYLTRGTEVYLLVDAPIEASQAASAPGVTAAPQIPALSYNELTIPSGSALTIRIADGLASGTALSGQVFGGFLDSDLTTGGITIAGRGSRTHGRVVEATEDGAPALTLTLTDVEINGSNAFIFTELLRIDSSAAALVDTVRSPSLGEFLDATGTGDGADGIDIPGQTRLEFQLSQPLTFRMPVATTASAN